MVQPLWKTFISVKNDVTFDHERIPERIVHARGFAAHGEFELYDSLSEYKKLTFYRIRL